MGKNTLNLVDKAIATKISNSLAENAYNNEMNDKGYLLHNLSNATEGCRKINHLFSP